MHWIFWFLVGAVLQVVYRQYEFVLNLNMDSQDTCKDKKFLKINLSLDKLKKNLFEVNG